MEDVRKEVADLVYELKEALDEDMPLAIRLEARPRSEIVADLVALGLGAIDPIAASVGFSSSKVRIELFNALGFLGTWPAMLALMRFIFDERKSFETAEERSFAMKNLAKLADPSYALQLSDFIKDIADDDDRWVQGFRIEIMGKIGDQSRRPFLERKAVAEDTLWREKAVEALHRLDLLLEKSRTRPEKLKKKQEVTFDKNLSLEEFDALVQQELADGPPVSDGDLKSLTVAERQWVNRYRYASPNERKTMAGKMPSGQAVRLLDALSMIDERGASVALQWVIAQAQTLSTHDALDVRSWVGTLLLREKSVDVQILAMRAITSLSREGFPCLEPEVLDYIGLALASGDQHRVDAAFNLARKLNIYKINNVTLDY